MRRDRLSSICSSTKKQKCTTPKSILSGNMSAKNSRIRPKGIKPKDKLFMFSQRRKTRKSSKNKENKFLSRIAKRLNTTVNIASPLASDNFGDLKYFNFAKHFVNGNKGIARATMTNALLSPNLMTTLKAIKKRNNSLGIVNKYNTLNSSSGSIKETYVRAAGDSNEREKSENDKEQDELFYKGIKSLDDGDPTKAISFFTKIVDSPNCNKKMTYVVLSIAYRRVQNYTEALKVLSKAIAKHPKFIEAFVARGQIYLFMKKWDKAFIDFRKVLQLQKALENGNISTDVSQNGVGFLGQGDALKGIGNYQGALSSYTSAIEVDSESQKQGYMKRGILNLQLKEYKDALEDFSKLIELDDFNPKAYYYRAKSLEKLGSYDDAVLSFEQVSKLSTDEYMQNNALYEITKIRVKQRDFYEAYYALQRADKAKQKHQKLSLYQGFTEGVIFLMKRKTKKGVGLLTTIIDKSPVLKDEPYLNSLIYIYRAYGRILLQEFDLALKDLLKASSIKKLYSAAYYNMYLCIGIISIRNKEFEAALSYFVKAEARFPKNRN